VDFSTSIPERFVKILRGSSLDPLEEDEFVAEEAVETVEPETNSGLILLAENYDKNSQKSLARGRIFGVVALIVLFVSSIVFSALAGYIWLGLAATLIAAVFVVLSRTSTSRGQEIKQIADALIQPEDKS
jgi:cobalamin biosynthesis protein CobD/CbiB